MSLGARLGPSDVGHRVVVRRLLRGETGPSGGPAFADVIGELESWEAGTLRVRRRDGVLVSINAADVVAGKRVPPPPPRRRR
jgi:N-acetylglutamate synthase